MARNNQSKVLAILAFGAVAYFIVKAIGNVFVNVPNNLQVGKVKIRRPSLSLTNITIPTDIEIVNYNSIQLTVDALYTTLIYKGRNIGNANFIQKVNIPSLRSAILPVNIQVSLLSLGQEITDAISAGGNILDILKRFAGSLEIKGSVYSGGIQFPINAPITF